jgi:hypothetical protein
MLIKVLLESFDFKRILCFGSCCQNINSCCKKKRRNIFEDDEDEGLGELFEEETEGEIL